MIRGLIKLMRPRQWVKNGFVFAPLIFAGYISVPGAIANALLATFLFCLASSAVYILNDIHDLEYDRSHPKKAKTRPLASGAIRIPEAVILLCLLYLILVWGYFQLPMASLVILGYLILNLAYTFFLKKIPVIDIFTIATGFVLRVFAGAMALSVQVSSWMFVTTLCLALYLAAIKRRQELVLSGNDGRDVLRYYTVALVDRYAEMAATGTLIFYSLYVMSEKPAMVTTIPLVLFGLFRYWFVVETLEGGESPTDALFSDVQLILAIILWVVAVVFAIRPI